MPSKNEKLNIIFAEEIIIELDSAATKNASEQTKPKFKRSSGTRIRHGRGMDNGLRWWRVCELCLKNWYNGRRL